MRRAEVILLSAKFYKVYQTQINELQIIQILYALASYRRARTNVVRFVGVLPKTGTKLLREGSRFLNLAIKRVPTR